MKRIEILTYYKGLVFKKGQYILLLNEGKHRLHSEETVSV